MTQSILQFFACEHLPPLLRAVSQLFQDVAVVIATMTPAEVVREIERRNLFENSSLFAKLNTDLNLVLPANDEATWAFLKLQQAADMFMAGEAMSLVLRQLLESKDCAVRAMMFKGAKA